MFINKQKRELSLPFSIHAVEFHQGRTVSCQTTALPPLEISILQESSF